MLSGVYVCVTAHNDANQPPTNDMENDLYTSIQDVFVCARRVNEMENSTFASE